MLTCPNNYNKHCFYAVLSKKKNINLDSLFLELWILGKKKPVAVKGHFLNPLTSQINFPMVFLSMEYFVASSIALWARPTAPAATWNR